MHFGKAIVGDQDAYFAGKYIDYAFLKSIINEEIRRRREGAVEEDDQRQTCITVGRPSGGQRVGKNFFDAFEAEFKNLGKTIDKEVSMLRAELGQLQKEVGSLKTDDEAAKEQLNQKGILIGDKFLRLEKFVNKNYLGLHKILKKHDKKLPDLACRQFYIAQLHKEPWLAGTFSDILVRLSGLFSKLRGDASGVKNEDASQGFVRSTSKYWVRQPNISQVKYAVLQHLPVFQFNVNPTEEFPADAQLINSVYLDNSLAELYHGRLDKRPDAIAMRLRWYGTGDPEVVFVERKTHKMGWKGELSVKERFALKEKHIIPFLENRYKVEEAVKEMRMKGKNEDEIDAFSTLFTECQKQIDSKQLRPMIRTQYMRTAFQIPFDATVRISLDTNLAMIKESIETSEGMPLQRWFRDPELPLARTDITRFPHAVLEVKLSLQEGTDAPAWVLNLTEDGSMCTEVHKFSKFVHGTCTLFPTLVQSVPYWVDDDSVRQSMIASAAMPPPILNQVEIQTPKPRTGLEGARPSRHPLLGVAPTLQLIQENQDSHRHDAQREGGPPKANFFDRIISADKPRLRTMPMKVEPKTFFANERTFLHWLHMAVTIGSISAALLGFASTADRSGKAAKEAGSVEVICMILLPVATVLCFYALFLFLWRSKMIAFTTSGAIDDKRGPLVLAGVVCVALFSIFVLALKDLVDTMSERKESATMLFASLVPA